MSARPSWGLIAILAVGIFSGGCRPATSEKGASAQPETKPWVWSAYPLASTLLVAQLPGTLSAPRSETIRSPAAGRLRLLPAAARGDLLDAGVHWAEIQPEDEAADDRAVARAEQQLKDRRENYRQKELPALLQNLDAEIAAAQETLALAQFAEKSPELFRGDHPALDPRLRPRLSSAQAQADLSRLQDRRRGMAQNEAAFEPADLQSLAAALQRAQEARADRQEHLILTMPFRGELRLARSAESSAVRIEAGEILAEIEDRSLLEIKIRASLPLLHAVAAESLSCRVAIPGGVETTGVFSSWGIEPGSAGEEPVIRFRVQPAAFLHSEGRLLGVALPVLIYTQLAEPARIVPKLDLAAADPAGALDAGWRQGIARLFPGSRFLAEGRAAVALLPP